VSIDRTALMNVAKSSANATDLLETKPRQVLRERVASDDLEWQRGKAWAFEQAMGVVWYYVDSNPVMSQRRPALLPDRSCSESENG
jgi:hypothetical protein